MSQDPSSVVTEEMRSWIGRTTLPRPIEQKTASDIRRYVGVTGDANPLWLDDKFASAHGYRARLLPPLLVGWEPFSTRGSDGKETTEDIVKQIPLPPEYTDARNANTEIEWLRPVYFGEQFLAQTCIVDIVARQGKSGIGIYVTREDRILDSNSEIVLKRQQTTVRFPSKEKSKLRN